MLLAITERKVLEDAIWFEDATVVSLWLCTELAKTLA